MKNENDENDMLLGAKKKKTLHEAVDLGDEICNLPATQRETDDDPPQILFITGSATASKPKCENIGEAHTGAAVNC